jgi:hypothetical protein
MKKIRIFIIIAVLISLMIPATVSAAGSFYCSTLRASGGSGTWADPWACATEPQFAAIVDTICEQYIGGFLYQIFDGYYVVYEIEWDDGCEIISTNRYPGYPPDTGPDLPMPVILSIAAASGAALVLVGTVMRRRKHTS